MFQMFRIWGGTTEPRSNDVSLQCNTSSRRPQVDKRRSALGQKWQLAPKNYDLPRAFETREDLTRRFEA
jgi:hypothetical protein